MRGILGLEAKDNEVKKMVVQISDYRDKNSVEDKRYRGTSVINGMGIRPLYTRHRGVSWGGDNGNETLYLIKLEKHGVKWRGYDNAPIQMGGE